MSNHILHAYALDGTGAGSSLENHAISQNLQDRPFTWVHLDGENPETKNWLESNVTGLDQFVIDALLVEETRPRVVELSQGVLLNLRGVNLNENADPEDMVSIRLWIESNKIISVRRRKLKAVRDIVSKIEAGKAPKTPGDFVCVLVSLLFKRLNAALSTLNEQTDIIETEVLESVNVSQREAIIDVRKQAILFRRYIAPQRDAISQLRAIELNILNDINRRYLQESLNDTTRYIEDLDAIRERAQIVKDEIASIMADKLNKNMYVLSIIAAIFLPLGFLTGLLGINVGGIPGADDSNAFWVFLFILATIVAIQIWIFKKQKWF